VIPSLIIKTEMKGITGVVRQFLKDKIVNQEFTYVATPE
jgi:hypothetical protein